MKSTAHISRMSYSDRGNRHRRRTPEEATNVAYPAYSDEDVSEESRRRRAEALRACGLLDQSRKYGNANSRLHEKLNHHRSKSMRSDSSRSDDRTLFGDVRYLLLPVFYSDIQSSVLLSFFVFERNMATRRSILPQNLIHLCLHQLASSAPLGCTRSSPESE